MISSPQRMTFWSSTCGLYFCMFTINKLNRPINKIVATELLNDAETQEVQHLLCSLSTQKKYGAL